MINLLAGICILLGVWAITQGANSFMDWATKNVNHPVAGLLCFAIFCVVVVSTWLFLASLVARGLTTSFG